MNALLIEYFNACIVESNKISFTEMNKLAYPAGYVVHPDVCNVSVKQFLKSVTVNPNATFYKEWNDVISRSRLELAIDQIMHYISVAFSSADDDVFVMNDYDYSEVPGIKNAKFIMPISVEEMGEKCVNVLYSGIALKQETMQAMADFIIKHKVAIDVDKVKNREAMIYLCNKLGVHPTDKFLLLGYIIYVTTGKTMIINNDEMFAAIANSSSPFYFNTLSQYQLEGLASIFLRYKNIFCAFKHNYRVDNSAYINMLRRMAVKLHQPIKDNMWQNIFAKEYSDEEIAAGLSKITAYKKVALMQACMQRLAATEGDAQYYIVRNEKGFLRKNYTPAKLNNVYLLKVYGMLKASLVEDVKKHSTISTTVVDPSTGEKVTTSRSVVVKKGKDMKVPMPTSEKSFIGNYPFGTSFKLTPYSYFGIYWRNEWGTSDFDLSFIDKNNCKIGWNSYYYDGSQNVVFSGDQTEARPEAAEIIMFKDSKNVTGWIKNNQYRTNSIRDSYRFDFIFGREKEMSFTSRTGYMVDPNSIEFRCSTNMRPAEGKEQIIGFVDEGDAFLMAVTSGKKIVSKPGNDNEIALKALAKKCRCLIDSVDILREAGFTIVDDTYAGEVDIDMTDLKKDSLIALMA